MKVITKFAIYDVASSQQKRTTYRIVQRGKTYAFERYINIKIGWEGIAGGFNAIEDVMKAIAFKELFTNPYKKRK